MTRLSLLTLAACGASLLFAAGPPPAPRLDQHGDPLPPGALARLGTVRLRWGHPPAHVELSPDRRWLAAAGQSAVELWDVRTGRVARRIDAPEDSSSVQAKFAPDSKSLLLVSWEPPDDKRPGEITGHAELYAVPSGARRYRKTLSQTAVPPRIVGSGKW